MEINCTFDGRSNIQRCFVSHEKISENHELKFTGQHQSGKTNMDVQSVEFNLCTVTKVPQGLTKIFPNLNILKILNSNLENICKSDLVEYKNIKRFNCNENEVKFLPADLFEGFENLEFISFNNNKLDFIEPNILDGLEKLKFVDFRGNSNYKKHLSIAPYSGSKATLDEVKLELFRNYHKKYELFKDLGTENQLLKESKQKLQTELEQEKLKSSELTDKTQTGFLNDLSTFIQDETTKDFQIQIDDQEFPVHKIVLAARSPTLAEILKNNPEVENLNLVDISVEIFEIVLKFLYTDELPGDKGINFIHLFAAAGKLKIEKLKNFAATKLMNQIDDDNALDVLKLSNKYDHEELRREAFKGIKKKYPNVELKDIWAADTEKLEKAIEIIKQREEADRKMKEEFKKLMN